MAEVGVLEIQIHDNSEKAASGLDNLAGALNSVKKALGNGLRLGNTANQIEKLVTKMQTAIPEESISRLERLAKAVETLNKAGGINLSGIKGLSKEIRENVSEIKSAAEGTVSTKSGAQNDFAKGLEEVRQIAQDTVEIAERIDAPLVEAGRTIGVAADNAERLLDAVAEISSYARLGSGSTPLRLGAGGVPDEKALSTWVDYSKQWQTGWTDGSDFHPGWEIKEEFDEASAAVYRFAQEMDSAIQKATELKTLMSGGSPLLLGAGGVPNENALSTWVDFSQQWQTGWTSGNNYSPLWTMAEGFDEVSAGIYRFATAMDEAVKKTAQFMALASGQSYPLLGAGNAGMELSTWVDQSRQWSTDWTYGQQPRLGDGNPDWIYGSGTVSEVQETADVVRESAQEIESSVENVSNTAQTSQDDIIGYARVWNDVTRQWESVGYTAEYLRNRIASVANASSADGMQNGFERTNSTVDELKSKLKDLAWLIKDATGGTDGLRDGFSRLVAPISNVVKQFNKLAKYRILRAIIKQISEGFKEGVENYYHYSAKINNGFSAAMDSATTSLLTFKNSIGAAVAPLIESIIPVLQQVVSWVVTAINYVNQFIALLSGKPTWSMAVDTTAKAFEATKKGAGGAKKAIKDADNAVKDLLADFDELNIIQSETGDNGGSGSGGGGGGSGKTATDYKKMFTEVSSFSDEIESAVNILKNGFGDVLQLAGLIGTAIIGWKISKAFEGVLGKLGKLTAGLSLSIIGIKLGYGAAVDIGETGALNAANVTSLIGGAVASAIGGSLISTAVGLSGGTGIVVGLTVSLIVDMIGYIQGKKDKEDFLKWGNKSLTPEEIKKLVKSQFSFDVDAEITILKGVITNEGKAREELDTKISNFKQSLTDANISVGMAVEKSDAAPSVIQAAQDAREAIAAIQRLIDTTHESLTTTLKILPPESGGESGEDVLANLKIADSTLKDYFGGLGEKMAHYMYEGQKTGWKNGEMDAILELMASQQRIVDRAEELRNDQSILVSAQAQTRSTVKNGVIDRDTAKSVLQEQTEALEEYESTVRQAEQTRAESYLNLWSLAKAAAEEASAQGDTETAKELESAAQTYKDQASSILENLEETVQSKTSEAKEKIAGYWAEVLGSVYGNDYQQLFGASTTDVSYWIFGDSKPGIESGRNLGVQLKKQLENSNPQEVGKWLNEYYTNLIKDADPNGIAQKAIELFGFSGLSVMPDEIRSQLLQYMTESLGDRDLAIDIFKSAFGISTWGDLEKYLQQETPEIEEATQGAADVMHESVADAFANTDWQNMADDEFDSFLLALKEKFGSSELTNFLNSGEVDIPASDVRIPLDVTLEETVTDVETNMDDELPWSNLWNDYDTSGSTGKIWTTSDMKASNAYRSGVNYTGGETIELQVDNAQEQANTQAGVQGGTAQIQTDLQNGMANRKSDIQNGVQAGTGSLLTALNNILAAAQAISRKEFTVNLVPSAGFGRFMGQSSDEYSRVTGDA